MPAPGRAGIIYEEDVEIILPDGVVLRADLFRPGDGAPVPVLIAWAAYIKDGERMGGGFIIDEFGSAEFIVPRGYALLRVQPRGTGRSGGASASEFYSATEIQDCRDTIDWAAGQGWCDGRVGMAGMSYFAIIQLLVAATRPPRLTAFFPLKGMTDLYRQGFYKGGAAYTGAMELMAAAEKLKPPPIPSGIRHALSHLLNRPPFLMHTSDAKANQTRFRRIMALVKPPEEACRSYVRRCSRQSL